jgi:hypothetical protein
LLHYKDCTRHLSTDDAEEQVQQLPIVNGKHVINDGFIEFIPEAKARARFLRKRHKKGGIVFPNDNPSTTMDSFVEALGM